MFNKCERYRRLKHLAEDGKATLRQESFVAKHEAGCQDCAEEHALTLQALEFLKSNVIEPEPDPTFESRFIRRWRVEKRARAVSYWMPAVVGAVVASVALLAVLQILFAAPGSEKIDLEGREAQLTIPSYGETVAPPGR